MSTGAQSNSSSSRNKSFRVTTRHIGDAVTGNDIRLIIASSVRLVREALTLALRGRNRLVLIDGVNIDPAGVARIVEAKPDVVVVDLARADAYETARLLNAACPKSKLVGFGLTEVEDEVFACAAAGFIGYVPRESGAEELHSAILDAVSGRLRCAPHMVAAMFRRLASLSQNANPRDALLALTIRENEILSLAEEGLSNKEIAHHLTISSATVKNHMHNVLQKLHVARRGQAAALHRSPYCE